MNEEQEEHWTTAVTRILITGGGVVDRAETIVTKAENVVAHAESMLRTIRWLCIALLIVSIGTAMTVGFIYRSVEDFHDRTLRIECEQVAAQRLVVPDC